MRHQQRRLRRCQPITPARTTPGADPTCADIDECATNNGNCGDAAYYTCSNNRRVAESDMTCATSMSARQTTETAAAPPTTPAAITLAPIRPAPTLMSARQTTETAADATYYTCSNNAGADPTCADIDECATNNGNCGRRDLLHLQQ